MLEKFWAWTDCDGHPENVLGRDELLDNVMLYWLNANAASSARLYWESFGGCGPQPVRVPTGVAAFPKEIVPPVRWCEAYYPNIQHGRPSREAGTSPPSSSPSSTSTMSGRSSRRCGDLSVSQAMNRCGPSISPRFDQDESATSLAELTHLVVRRYLVVVGAGVGASDRPA